VSALPLAGVTVVSCEQAVAAPLATRHLADLGARVIKVERRGRGDFARDYDTTVHGQSSHFVWLNRSKESITLDLKQPAAIDIIHELIGRADVFVQNLAPGAADRLGVSPDSLVDRHPRLVTCSISGYGSDGPYRDAKAYDMLIQAEAGLLSITGTKTERARSAIPVADIAAGMYAFSGVMAALYERERTGRGSSVEVGMLDCLAEWMGFPLYFARYGGEPPGLTGIHHPAIAPYGVFSTGDDQEVMLAVQNDREWRAFAGEVLGRADLAVDPRFVTGSARVAHRSELHAEIRAVFSTVTRTELKALLDRAGIANGQAREVADVWHHPQLVERSRVTTVSTPGGRIKALLPPIAFPGREPRMDPVPALGEQTSAILAEIGYDARSVALLREHRTI
jgi:crotonobetainyl-CoA:carnitine CoA-transferase CaiB-like acyl-CoA transferase